MKNVLCVDYFFPPLSSNWRAVAFSKYLPLFGWNPIFLSAAESVSYDKDFDLLAEVPRGIEVHRVGHSEPPRLLELGMRACRCSMSFPDRYASWIKPALQVAREIINNERIDLLYSSSPTFATAWVAQTLREETDIPWVADFLDGWSVNNFLLNSLKTELWAPLRYYHLRRIRAAEKSFLEKADTVTVIHPHVKKRWVELHGIEPEQISVVTDGFEEEVFKNLGATRIFKNHTSITFLGSHYRQFNDDVRRFLSVVEEIDPRLRVLFVGRGSDRFKRLSSSNAVYMSAVHRSDALRIGAGSDYVFVTMPEYARWSPTKVYDYLRLGTHIIGLVPKDSDPARLIEGVGGTVLPYERDQMKSVLSELFSLSKKKSENHYDKNRSFVDQFERAGLTRDMADIFDATVSSI